METDTRLSTSTRPPNRQRESSSLAPAHFTKAAGKKKSLKAVTGLKKLVSLEEPLSLSLLPATTKCFEPLVLRRVRDDIERFNILIPEQFGFRSGHSFIHQLMRAVECIAEAWCSGNKTAAVFLDIEKALDRVSYEGLLFKLKESLFPNCYIHRIASFFRDRTFGVRIDQ